MPNARVGNISPSARSYSVSPSARDNSIFRRKTGAIIPAGTPYGLLLVITRPIKQQSIMSSDSARPITRIQQAI